MQAPTAGSRIMRKKKMFVCLAVAGVIAGGGTLADPLPPDATYRPLPTLPLDLVRRNDEGAKPAVQRRQQNLFNERYDMADRPMQGVKMSGGRKGVQDGVRVKLRPGTSWDSLANMTPDDIK